MEFKKISSPTLKELFVTEIESMILSGELAIGEKLPPERELAQQMQISRSVVNDGIVDLAHRGFLNIIPRQGTYVADYKKYGTIDILIAIMKNGSITEDYIHSVLDIRQIFMDYALEHVVPDITDENILALRQILHSFHETTIPHDWAELMYDFDHLLTVLSGNILLPILFSSFKIPNVMLLERYFKLHGLEPMDKRNRLLIDAIEQRDVEKAKSAIQDSIRETINGSTKIYYST